jgi:hypothetical protein
MLSRMLPRRLGAYEAWRFHENLEDERVRFLDPVYPPFSIVPESFRMEFSRPVDYESVIAAVRIFCEECGADFEVKSDRKRNLNIPPRAIVRIRPKGSKSFNAVILVEEGFVSFTSFP